MLCRFAHRESSIRHSSERYFSVLSFRVDDSRWQFGLTPWRSPAYPMEAQRQDFIASRQHYGARPRAHQHRSPAPQQASQYQFPVHDLVQPT